MSLVEMIVPMIKGGFLLLFFSILMFVFYQFFKVIGVIAFIKKVFRKPTDDDIYEEVAEMIMEDKTFKEFAGMISKYKKEKQEMYLRVYLEIQSELNKKEGDKNGKKRKTKRASRKD